MHDDLQVALRPRLAEQRLVGRRILLAQCSRQALLIGHATIGQAAQAGTTGTVATAVWKRKPMLKRGIQNFLISLHFENMTAGLYRNFKAHIAVIQIDSRTIRERFDTGPFTGQLYLHAVGIAAHDVVKYALDVWSDDGMELSCTHDANAWPSDHYAGLPAPRDGETVVLWVQNSHPSAIPARGIGLNLMGRPEISWLDKPIPGFGTYVTVFSYQRMGILYRYGETDAAHHREIDHVVADIGDFLVRDTEFSGQVIVGLQLVELPLVNMADTQVLHAMFDYL